MRHRQPRSPPRPPRISRHWNRPVPRNALPRTEESRRVTRATPVRPRRHALVSTQPSVRRGRVHVRGLRISADGTRRAAIPPQPPETSRTERLFRVRILAWPCRTTCPVSIVDARREKGIEIVRLEESRFDPRTGRLPVEFRFFVFGGGRVLDRFDELHTIQTYTVRGMRELLRRGGFNLLGTFAATNVKKGFRPVSRNTFRIMAVARAR